MKAQNYIATWFYQESKEEASYYPQVGGRGDSSLLHSIYMQIQWPFFVTFRHYNPEAHLMFFTNVANLPTELEALFHRLGVEMVRLPYTLMPPQGWYQAWRNQFYLYDIWQYMEKRMTAEDRLLICDADCLCTTSLDPLFDRVAHVGSALYEFTTDPDVLINGITLRQMEDIYEECYGQRSANPLFYYGGEFIVLRGDKVQALNAEYARLWEYNKELFERSQPKLNEEALFFSVLAERMDIRNNLANRYVKRMWTSPQYNNVEEGDVELAVWHLPYEKKRGLYRLYRMLRNNPRIESEETFWNKASCYVGIPRVGWWKRVQDRLFIGLQQLSR